MPEHAIEICVGPYSGIIAADLRKSLSALSPDSIGSLPGFSAGNNQRAGSAYCFVSTIEANGSLLPVHVKVFGRQNGIKDFFDKTTGSRARRSWNTAVIMGARGIGTPRPLAFFERWDGRRLRGSYLVTEFQNGASTFRDELIRLYNEEPYCDRFMSLLETVARAVRGLHDGGIVHFDLGNQNIILRRLFEDKWGGVQFVDLNRALVVPRISQRERAFDISRISLPSDFLRVFKEMYFQTVVPNEFQRWERFYRRKFALHTKTRFLRHPLRTRLAKHHADAKYEYPPEKDMWVWDHRSLQAISPLTSRDRRQYQSSYSHLSVAAATLGSAGSVFSRYRTLRDRCFQNRVAMESRVALCVEATPATVERQFALIEPLGAIPLMLRFYSHENARQWSFTTGVMRSLRDRGHPVSAALVQDRRAVTEPGVWDAFVGQVLGQIHDCVDLVEVGHAINRAKWGIWSLRDHSKLMQSMTGMQEKYPDVKFIGPAGIDFEFPFVVGAVGRLPHGLQFNALSHHLYVDRRGAPENKQGRFSAVEKFVLGRAISESFPQCGGRFIVSEVNWPIAGTGVYSPVGSPYVSPGPRFNDPSVSEAIYADYMIRYLVLACCSGMVDRVYWWNLVARGFGLVDDSEPGTWRERRAYSALRHFVACLGKGTFERRVSRADGMQAYLFEIPGGRKVALAYSLSGSIRAMMPFTYSGAVDLVGDPVGNGGSDISLSGSPVYMFDVA